MKTRVWLASEEGVKGSIETHFLEVCQALCCSSVKVVVNV